jgi:hypothetical protein
MLVQAISLTEERIMNELPGIEPLMAKDTNGRFLMLDAYATLANFRAARAREAEAGLNDPTDKPNIESYLSSSPNRPTVNKL